jgi:6,7-dimethyl-8-ribityllumazine synthase
MEQRKVLIIEANHNREISTQLLEGAVRELESRGIDFKHVVVPDMLEIPTAMRYAVRSMEMKTAEARYIGYIALGTAILTEDASREHMAQEATHGAQTLSMQYSLALGNGIIVAKDENEAKIMASLEGKNIGAQAAKTALHMIELKKLIGL